MAGDELLPCARKIGLAGLKRGCLFVTLLMFIFVRCLVFLVTFTMDIHLSLRALKVELARQPDLWTQNAQSLRQ